MYNHVPVIFGDICPHAGYICHIQDNLLALTSSTPWLKLNITLLSLKLHQDHIQHSFLIGI